MSKLPMMTKIDKTNLDMSPRSMEARYQRAQHILQGTWTNNIAFNDTVYPTWIGESDCFWYERTLKTGEGEGATFGKEYRLVDAKAATNTLAFDHQAFAAALAKAAGEDVDVFDLPIKDVEFSANLLSISFTAFEKRWIFDSKTKTCSETALLPARWLPSPDAKKVVFVRDHNLWVRDLVSQEEKPLTHDGDYETAYGATPLAWGTDFDANSLPQVQWSPDSKRVLAAQRETRQVKSFPVIHHLPKDGSVRPQLVEAKLALPGDEHIETMRLVVVNVETGNIQCATKEPIPVYGLGAGFFTEGKGWWSANSQKVYYVEMERGYKKVRVIEYTIESDAARVLFEETSETRLQLNLHYDDRPAFLPLPDTSELLWYSERSGWAHLYLYDLESGLLKNSVSKGDWLVREVLSFDAARREVFVRTAGRGAYHDGSAPNPERDPYYCDLARIHIDSGEISTLAAGDHEYVAVSMKNFSTWVTADMGHDVRRTQSVSPTGNFAVVTRSRADEVPVSLLFDREGKEVLTLEVADTSALPDGWQWPEPVKLLAADGKTDVYGLVFRPSDFSPEKSYPVVSHMSNCPEFVFVSKGAFNNGAMMNWMYLDPAAIAELGFIVVQIDGRGSPLREKAFHDESYGDYASASNIDDHAAGIRQLAERYPYMDLDRVGITTHLAGGTAGAMALIEHSDLYSVAVHGVSFDTRCMSASMTSEQYEGVPRPNIQPVEEKIDRMNGKLLLLHGLIDVGVPATGTFRLVEALQKANKDYDLIVSPTMGHVSMPNYFIRRMWDFLVRHLVGAEPPRQFELKSSAGGYSPPVNTHKD